MPLLTYSDGGYYEGEWVGGVRQGVGVIMYQNNNIYEGEWVDDLRHGRGRYINVNTGYTQVD